MFDNQRAILVQQGQNRGEFGLNDFCKKPISAVVIYKKFINETLTSLTNTHIHTHRRRLVGLEFPFFYLFRYYCAFICLGGLLNLGNTMNTKYLKQIQNPEYLTGANQPERGVIVFLKFSRKFFTDKIQHKFTTRFLQKTFLQKIGA